MEKTTLLFFCALAVIFPVLKAHVGVFDEFWQKREADSRDAARNAYKPNPDEVVHHLNYHVKL